jgi:DNA repair protein RecO (recombination protein O)
MAPPRVYQTEAIILKRTRLGEADRILTLFTSDYGKVSAIAKGASRPGSKFGGHVELLTHSLFLLAKGHNLDVVTQVQTINSFITLKEDLQLLSYGMYIAELIDSFTDDDFEDKKLFAFIIDTLQRLSEAKHVDTALRYFELHLLDHMGYRPQLQKCTFCGADIKPATNCFSVSEGGVLCIDCGFEEPVVRPLSLNALKVLRLWQNCDYDTAIKVIIKPELALELQSLLREYMKHVLERQIKSTSWMDILKNQTNAEIRDEEGKAPAG